MLTTLAVLDFEAACADPAADPQWISSQQELIELPVALVSISDRKVVDTFATLVRPTRQPLLTTFCTKLSTIRQEDLEGQPDIEEAVRRLTAWLDVHGVTAENTCAVTCGDWDLRRMWPLQASLVPGLPTPPLFRSWANLKVAFAAVTGVRATGMTGMLQELGLTHEGVHHRGVDDVGNLCRIVIRLLEAGGEVVPTWGEREREAERKRYEERLRDALAAEEAKRSARDRLPSFAPRSVRDRLDEQLTRLSCDVARLRAYVSVFS